MHQTCPGLLSANWEGNQLTRSYPPHSVKTTSAPTCRRYSHHVAWKLGGSSRTFYPGWPATQVCRVRARPEAAVQRSLYDCQLWAPGVLPAVSSYDLELLSSVQPSASTLAIVACCTTRNNQIQQVLLAAQRIRRGMLWRAPCPILICVQLSSTGLELTLTRVRMEHIDGLSKQTSCSCNQLSRTGPVSCLLIAPICHRGLLMVGSGGRLTVHIAHELNKTSLEDSQARLPLALIR